MFVPEDCFQSVDPDEMPHNALGLHCLPKYMFLVYIGLTAADSILFIYHMTSHLGVI